MTYKLNKDANKNQNKTSLKCLLNLVKISTINVSLKRKKILPTIRFLYFQFYSKEQGTA